MKPAFISLALFFGMTTLILTSVATMSMLALNYQQYLLNQIHLTQNQYLNLSCTETELLQQALNPNRIATTSASSISTPEGDCVINLATPSANLISITTTSMTNHNLTHTLTTETQFAFNPLIQLTSYQQ